MGHTQEMMRKQLEELDNPIKVRVFLHLVVVLAYYS